MTEPLPVGKLPADLLASLLATIEGDDEAVIIGPGVGRDATAVRVGDRVLVLKTDPITFATDRIGWYTVNVNANDVACMGARPRWLLVTGLLPETHTTRELVSWIFDDLRDACRAVGVRLVGGHTEITAGLDRPILVGHLIGEVAEDALINPGRARPGDAILLARGIAIEGTALVAREMPERLAEGHGELFIERCREFLHAPGISVVPAAAALSRALGPRLHALHDPTEGGLATGLQELGVAAGLGLVVNRHEISIYPETRAICDILGLDPLGLIASGALLATIDPAAVDEARAALRSVGIPSARIGRMTETQGSYQLISGDWEEPLPVFAVDEIARMFAESESGG